MRPPSRSITVRFVLADTRPKLLNAMETPIFEAATGRVFAALTAIAVGGDATAIRLRGDTGGRRFEGSTITGLVDGRTVLMAINTRYASGMAGLLAGQGKARVSTPWYAAPSAGAGGRRAERCYANLPPIWLREGTPC